MGLKGGLMDGPKDRLMGELESLKAGSTRRA